MRVSLLDVLFLSLLRYEQVQDNYTRMNTPREWEEEFDKMAQISPDTYPDEKVIVAHYGKLKSFIRTIEDKARKEERERVRKLVEGLDESEGECGRPTEEACAAFSKMCRHDGYSNALSDIITALNERV